MKKWNEINFKIKWQKKSSNCFIWRTHRMEFKSQFAFPGCCKIKILTFQRFRLSRVLRARGNSPAESIITIQLRTFARPEIPQWICNSNSYWQKNHLREQRDENNRQVKIDEMDFRLCPMLRWNLEMWKSMLRGAFLSRKAISPNAIKITMRFVIFNGKLSKAPFGREKLLIFLTKNFQPSTFHLCTSYRKAYGHKP